MLTLSLTCSVLPHTLSSASSIHANMLITFKFYFLCYVWIWTRFWLYLLLFNQERVILNAELLLWFLQALEYLLDDVCDFLSLHYKIQARIDGDEGKDGCANILKSFLDYISMRESENFRSRRKDNDNSITLTTIHQVIHCCKILDFFS